MKRDLRICTFGDPGHWYAVLYEYRPARAKRDGHAFTKHINTFTVEGGPFAERSEARRAAARRRAEMQ